MIPHRTDLIGHIRDRTQVSGKQWVPLYSLLSSGLPARGEYIVNEYQTNQSNLKRDRQPMPEFVKHALLERSLMDAYDERPPYQRNDYLLWINSARRQETKEKRLLQMLDELETGGVYMNMKHPGSRKK